MTAVGEAEVWVKLAARADKLGISDTTFAQLKRQYPAPEQMKAILDQVEDSLAKSQKEQQQDLQEAEEEGQAGAPVYVALGEAQSQAQQTATVQQPSSAATDAAIAPIADDSDDDADDTSDSTSSDMQKAATTSLIAGLASMAMQQGLQMVLQEALTSMLQIGEDSAALAYSTLASDTLMANTPLVTGWIWQCQFDTNSCISCIMMDGSVHDDSETLDSHINCFPSGVLVSGPRAVGSTTRWYNGEIVEIETARGYVLPVTPNHPILTSHGWVAAGLLKEGGDVISRTLTEARNSSRAAPPDQYQIPTPIEQVAVTFGGIEQMRSVSMPCAPEEFHGDGKGSQVYVVRTSSQLWNGLNAPFSEPQLHQQLFGRCVRLASLSSTSTLLSFCQRYLAATYRFLSGKSTTSPHFGRDLAGLEFAGLGLSTGAYTSPEKPPTDSPARDIKSLSERLFRLSGLISAHNLIRRDRTLLDKRLTRVEANHAVSFLGRTKQSTLLEHAADTRISYMEPVRDRLQAFAGDVSEDRILKIRRRRFLGHVYNLQTTEHWYLANSIVSHNCECQQIPYSGPPLDDLGTGEAWFLAQDDAIQQAILGPAAWSAWDQGDVQLADLVSHEGGYAHEASLKSLGIDYRQYLKSTPSFKQIAENVAYAPEMPKLPELPGAGENEADNLLAQSQDLRAQRADAVTKLETYQEQYDAVNGRQLEILMAHHRGEAWDEAENAEYDLLQKQADKLEPRIQKLTSQVEKYSNKITKLETRANILQGGKGYVIIDETHGRADAVIQQLFGRDLSHDELGMMVGGQQGDYVIIADASAENKTATFELRSSGYDPKTGEGSLYEARRSIGFDADGTLVMNNESFYVSEDMRGQGLGAHIFGDQISTDSTLGIDHIWVAAAGNPVSAAVGGENGFYTWARFGYQADLADLADEGLDLDALHEAFPGVDTLQDLMLQPGGPEWWRENGVSFRGTFDLTEGSTSRQMLDGYLQAKGIEIPGIGAAEEATTEARSLEDLQASLKDLQASRSAAVADRNAIQAEAKDLRAQATAAKKAKGPPPLDLTTNPDAKFIAEKDVAAWTASNADSVPDIGYHAGSQASIDHISQDGVDLTLTENGAYGRGFYMFSGHDVTGAYGPADVRVALHMENPLVFHSDAELDTWLHDANPSLADLSHAEYMKAYPDAITKAALEQGYDGIIMKSPELEQMGGDMIVAINPGTARVINDEAAKEAKSTISLADVKAAQADNAARLDAAKAKISNLDSQIASTKSDVQAAKDAAALQKLQDSRDALVAKQADLQAKRDDVTSKTYKTVKQQAAADKKLVTLDTQMAANESRIDALEAKINAAPVAHAAESMEPPLGVQLTYTLPEIDQEAENAVIQAAQDAIGVDSHTDAIALGSQIDSYLDDRIGPLADWSDEAADIYTKYAAGTMTDLSGDQIAWVNGFTADHGGYTMQEALEQFQAAKRQETLRLLSQVRDVGGTDFELAGGATSALEDAVRSAQDVFPTDWIEASNDQGDLRVITESTRRGFYRAGSTDGDGVIGLRATDNPDALYTAMVHELGHRMEDSVDGVWQMEQDFYDARTAGEELVNLSADLRVAGRTRPDDFASDYLGRDPIRTVRAARVVGADGDALGTVYSYELLSSGLEWLLGSDYRGAWMLSKDPEYRQFILGILFGAKDQEAVALDEGVSALDTDIARLPREALAPEQTPLPSLSLTPFDEEPRTGTVQRGYTPEDIATTKEDLEQARSRARDADADLAQETWRILADHPDARDWENGGRLKEQYQDASYEAAREEMDSALSNLRELSASFERMATPEDTDAATQQIFGRTLSDDELTSLVGAPSDADVVVSTDGTKLLIRTDGDAGPDATFFTKREVYIEKGKIVIHNDYFMIDGETGQGFGTKVFSDEVEGARALGASKIVTLAARQEGVFNGYYTWPRLGYDAILPKSIQDGLPDSLRGATRVSHLMKTEEGRAWWKEHGIQMEMSFNLSPTATSSRVLDAYASRKGYTK